MARKQKHEEHENHERWLVSYADFITLLFAFFVVMYSISAVNEGRFRVLSEALVAAFRAQPKALEPIQVGHPLKSRNLEPQGMLKSPRPSPDSSPIEIPRPIPSPIKKPLQGAGGDGEAETPMTRAIKEMADEIERALDQLIRQDLVAVRRSRLWLEVEIKTSILFPSGSAGVEAHAVPVLERIAAILKRFPNPIHVEGFTDNVPISTIAYPSNWELSAARAASVVHLFNRAGVSPERMAAIGFGEYHPVADNATAEGRNKNRRVILVVLADAGTRRPLDFAPEGGAVNAPGAPDTGPPAAESVHGTSAPPPAAPADAEATAVHAAIEPIRPITPVFAPIVPGAGVERRDPAGGGR